MGGELQGLGLLSEEDEAGAKIYWSRMWSFFQALKKVHQSLTRPPQQIRVKSAWSRKPLASWKHW